MPRGSVIPTGWAAHHQPVAESTMTGYCRIYAPDTQVYDPNQRMDVPSFGLIRWEGMARVQQHNFESTYRIGAMEVRSRAYLLAVPANVNNVNIYDVARFEAAGDGALIEMLIVSVMKGSERFQRDMIALDIQQMNLYKAAQ